MDHGVAEVSETALTRKSWFESEEEWTRRCLNGGLDPHVREQVPVIQCSPVLTSSSERQQNDVPPWPPKLQRRQQGHRRT
jgi:hypothetical protein